DPIVGDGYEQRSGVARNRVDHELEFGVVAQRLRGVERGTERGGTRHGVHRDEVSLGDPVMAAEAHRVVAELSGRSGPVLGEGTADLCIAEVAWWIQHPTKHRSRAGRALRVPVAALAI